MIHSELLDGSQVLVKFTPGENCSVSTGGSPPFFRKAVPVGLEVPLRAGGASLVLVLKGSRGSAPPEGLLRQGLESHRLGWRSVGRGGNDATRKEQYRKEQSSKDCGTEDGGLMHGQYPSTYIEDT